MINTYVSNGLPIEPNQFYILTLGNNIDEVVSGEKILEMASEEDGGYWVVDGPINETDLIGIIRSTAGCA